jgi:hypothetical protein
VKCVLRKHDEVDRAHAAFGLADHRDDLVRLRGDVGARRDLGQLQLHQADDDAVRGFVEPTQTIHCACSFNSDRGLSRR